MINLQTLFTLTTMEYKKLNIPEKLNTSMEGRVLSRRIRESHEQHLQHLAARLTDTSAGGHHCTTNNPPHNCAVWPPSYILAPALA